MSGNRSEQLQGIGADKVLHKGDGFSIIKEIFDFAAAAAAAKASTSPCS